MYGSTPANDNNFKVRSVNAAYIITSNQGLCTLMVARSSFCGVKPTALLNGWESDYLGFEVPLLKEVGTS